MTRKIFAAKNSVLARSINSESTRSTLAPLNCKFSLSNYQYEVMHFIIPFSYPAVSPHSYSLLFNSVDCRHAQKGKKQINKKSSHSIYLLFVSRVFVVRSVINAMSCLVRKQMHVRWCWCIVWHCSVFEQIVNREKYKFVCYKADNNSFAWGMKGDP